jgi:hypothetical protein
MSSLLFTCLAGAQGPALKCEHLIEVSPYYARRSRVCVCAPQSRPLYLLQRARCSCVAFQDHKALQQLMNALTGSPGPDLAVKSQRENHGEKIEEV